MQSWNGRATRSIGARGRTPSYRSLRTFVTGKSAETGMRVYMLIIPGPPWSGVSYPTFNNSRLGIEQALPSWPIGGCFDWSSIAITRRSVFDHCIRFVFNETFARTRVWHVLASAPSFRDALLEHHPVILDAFLGKALDVNGTEVSFASCQPRLAEGCYLTIAVFPGMYCIILVPPTRGCCTAS